MKRAEDVFRRLAVVLAVAAAVSMAGSKLLFGWGSVFSYRVFYVMSGSMEPAIHEGEFVIGRLLAGNEEPVVGEVYAYRRDGSLWENMVIHRLVGDECQGSYWFKGDANQQPDSEPVAREEIGFWIMQ